MAAKTVKGNPIEALVTQFRTVVGDLEVLSGDEDLANKVKRSRHIQQLVSDLGDALDAHEVNVNESFTKELESIYEAMVLSQDSEVGDDALKRRVEAAAALAEDFGIERTEIDQLIERYNQAKDKFMEMTQVKSGGGKASATGRYGNSHDGYRSDSVRGVKRHLTVAVDKDWKEKGIKVLDMRDGSEVTE